ncbi:hypothetical protein JXA48_02375 [Candidatus Woesearchaeota archaeon]|nr:hypothetical protein [Candidatus Woesearchaeota archaeon]
METHELTTIIRRLSKLSDNKFGTNYHPNLVVVEKNVDEYNGFNIQTVFDDNEDKRLFAKDILSPIEEKYKIVFHQYSRKRV